MRVEIVEDAARLHAVAELFRQVFGEAPGRDAIPPEMLKSVAHAGGAVHVAYIDDEPSGAAVLIFGPPRSESVYSIIAAARASDHGVGFTLKQAQREWALAHGATVMRWTFDPLVSRNARFNLVKLGARAVTYDIDFYGAMTGINAGGPSDRFTVEWDLVSPHATDPPAPTSVEATAAPDGQPFTAHDDRGLWCRVPHDIVAMRQSDPDLATRWRLAVREVLAPALRQGYVAVGMTRDGWYRLEPR